jgi:hypothetical protein
MKKIFKKLPQIIDFAGLGNHNTPELTEILELLIGGKISESLYNNIKHTLFKTYFIE